MKAMVLTRFGPPEALELKELPKPEPKPKEIRIRVMATSVGYGDLLIRNFAAVGPKDFNMPFLFWMLAKIFSGITSPKTPILGSEFSGVVDALGAEAKGFAIGDEVFGYLGQSMGADAEYFCMAADGCVAQKPSNLDFEAAAVVPYGSIMALDILRAANIQPGQKILINGASGSIGRAAVQIAVHHFGASVTGVSGPAGLDYVKSLGAEKVIDYRREDFTKSGDKYDLIVDVLGKSSFSDCKGSLTESGCYLRPSFKGRELLQMVWTKLSGAKQRVLCVIAPGNRAALETVKELIEAGKLKATVDRKFRLEELAEAHRYAESGQRGGPVAISVAAA